MSEKLKPCPFCPTGRPLQSRAGVRFMVFCQDCKAQTAIYDTEEEAIAKWNRRVADDTVAELNTLRLRVRALENAIKSPLINANSSGIGWAAACGTCINCKSDGFITCGGDCGKEKRNWEFDLIRFTKNEVKD